MTYTAEMDYVPPDTAVHCENCGWHGTFTDVADIDTCVLTPGDPSPAGRCPECESLVYPEETGRKES